MRSQRTTPSPSIPSGANDGGYDNSGTESQKEHFVDWWWEMGAASFSLACVASIVAILSTVQDKARSEWTFLILPNSLVAIFSTFVQSLAHGSCGVLHQSTQVGILCSGAACIVTCSGVRRGESWSLGGADAAVGNQGSEVACQLGCSHHNSGSCLGAFCPGYHHLPPPRSPRIWSSQLWDCIRLRSDLWRLLDLRQRHLWYVFTQSLHFITNRRNSRSFRLHNGPQDASRSPERRLQSRLPRPL